MQYDILQLVISSPLIHALSDSKSGLIVTQVDTYKVNAYAQVHVHPV